MMKILRTIAVAILALAVAMPAAAATKEKKERRERRKKAKTEQTVQHKTASTAAKHETAPAADEQPAAEQPIVYSTAPADLDVLLAEWYEQNVFGSMDEFFSSYVNAENNVTGQSVQSTPDSVFVRRLRELVSPVPLAYNEIVKNIINLYIGSPTGKMGDILRLAPLYMPMIEEELINAGLPVELRMMPVIESALNPIALSRAGALGLWQFMPATGKLYGLEINSLVDERCDPVAATRAACRYMKDMYALYGDWTLAIASYNCGAGNVNKALARAGSSREEHKLTFWDVYPYLPRETRGYVPAFIAATYAYNYNRHHDLEILPPPRPLATDTLQINRVMHLEQISSTIDCPLETLKALNPQYKLNIIPASTKTYTLVLPQTAVSEYISRESDIMAKDSLYLKEYINPANLDKKKQEAAAAATRTYKVKRGDTLGSIAKKHGVTVANLMKWNNIKKANLIREGQVLKIYR